MQIRLPGINANELVWFEEAPGINASLTCIDTGSQTSLLALIPGASSSQTSSFALIPGRGGDTPCMGGDTPCINANELSGSQGLLI